MLLCNFIVQWIHAIVFNIAISLSNCFAYSKIPVYSQTPNPDIYWGTDLGISSSVTSPESTDSTGDGRPLVSAARTWHVIIKQYYIVRYKWLRALDSRLREPGFKSCAAVLKLRASFFPLHCSSSLSCINECMAIDSGGYVYEQPSCINCSIWLDASLRSWDGVWLNRSARELQYNTAIWYPFRLPVCGLNSSFSFASMSWHFVCDLVGQWGVS